MSSLCFSFLQLKVLDSFIGVKLSLIKFFVPSLNLCYFYYFASFFLFSKIGLQLFLLTKVTIVFFDSNLILALPNLWQAPMSFFWYLFVLYLFSKLLWMKSGIPLRRVLFLLPYWVREFCSIFPPVC